MRLLRQSTTQTIMVGPFVDKDDTVTPETGLAGDGTELSKDGGTYAAGPTLGTHDSDGEYPLALTTGNTGTLGLLKIKIIDAATHLPVWHEYGVVPANVYDALYLGTDKLEVDMVEIEGGGLEVGNLKGALGNADVIDSNVTEANGSPGKIVDWASHITANGMLSDLKLIAGNSTTPATLNNLLNDAYDIANQRLKSDPVALNGVVQSLLDLKDFADAGYDPATNKVEGVKLVDANTDMRGTDGVDTATMRGTDGVDTATMRGTDSAATAAAQTSMQTDVTSVLARLGSFTATGVNTVLGFFKALMSKTATDPSDLGGTYAAADDSNEAIRDRGDAAWSSASMNPDVLEQTTIATLASQTSFTLTAGSVDDDAYNGAKAVVTDASSSVQKAVGEVLDYDGASKTVTLKTDPGIFTMAIGDSIDIVAVAKQLDDLAPIKAKSDNLTFNGTNLDSNLKEINDLSVVGNVATLTLKQFLVDNPAGDAVCFESTGGNGSGFRTRGHGTGPGNENIGGDSGVGQDNVGGSSGGAGQTNRAQTNSNGQTNTGKGAGHGTAFIKGVTGKDIDADQIDDIKAKTDNLPADPASETNVNETETKVDTVLARLGAFTGTGINNILGFFLALMKSDATDPSDVGGTYAAATDSNQAISDMGAGSDWSSAEKEQIRDSLGVDGTKTAATAGQVQDIKAKTDNLPADPASETNVDANETKLDTLITGQGTLAAEHAALSAEHTGINSNVDAAEAAILAAITALNDLDASGVSAAVWNATRTSHVAAGSMGRNVMLILSGTVSKMQMENKPVTNEIQQKLFDYAGALAETIEVLKPDGTDNKTVLNDFAIAGRKNVT